MNRENRKMERTSTCNKSNKYTMAGAVRTYISPSKRKWEINTNSQNTKKTYGQPSVQNFPKGGHSATKTELK